MSESESQIGRVVAGVLLVGNAEVALTLTTVEAKCADGSGVVATLELLAVVEDQASLAVFLIILHIKQRFYLATLHSLSQV
jgi:hypothetical protein